MSSWFSSFISKIKRGWVVNPASKPYIPSQSFRHPAPSSQAKPNIPEGHASEFNIAYYPRDPAILPDTEIILNGKGEIIKGQATIDAKKDPAAEGFTGPAHMPRSEWMNDREAAKILKWCDDNKLPPRMGRPLKLTRSSDY